MTIAPPARDLKVPEPIRLPGISEPLGIESAPRGLAAESGRAIAWAPREVEEAVAAIAATETTPDAPAELIAIDTAVETTARIKGKFRVFTLIDPNRLWVMIVAMALLGGILTASLASSFTSVYAMAAWVGLPAAVQWLPVVILDVAIVGFSWALMVFSTRAADEESHVVGVSLRQARKNAREKTGRTRMLLIWVTTFSVVANFMHTYDYWNGDLLSPQAITGAVFSASIPLMAFGATEELIRLVFVRRKRVNVGEQV